MNAISAADAWLQGGAALVLIVFVSVVLYKLDAERRHYRAELDKMIEAERQLLSKAQERDQEELRELRRLRSQQETRR